jgi:hypothetical protein
MEIKRRRVELPILPEESCSFEGYYAASLMAETAKLRKLITKRGTLEILIPLCCTRNPVRYMKFRQTLKGFSSKTLPSGSKNFRTAVSWKGKHTTRFQG